MKVEYVLSAEDQAIIDEIRAARSTSEQMAAWNKHWRYGGPIIPHTCTHESWQHGRPCTPCPIAVASHEKGEEIRRQEADRIKAMSPFALLEYMVDGPGAGIIFEGGGGTDHEYAAITERFKVLKTLDTAAKEG